VTKFQHSSLSWTDDIRNTELVYLAAVFVAVACLLLWHVCCCRLFVAVACFRAVLTASFRYET
jgi:hypothetical protein